MDEAMERYLSGLAAAAARALGDDLVGCYLHGSAVLGGFDARHSDVDVLVVAAGATSAAQRASLTAGLAALPCPAVGLELSVVTRAAAAGPTAAPRFELHLTTARDDPKVVDGHARGGDPDLVLHFAVCCRAGRVVGPGPAAAAVFAPVPAALVLAQLVAELGWAVGHATGEYAVLNACRAWRFAVDGALVSKVDGGRWARDRVGAADRALIAAALARQRREAAVRLHPAAVAAFVQRIGAHLTAP
ncbi:aminoglycoside adenylyltransferase domain-containing protein [Actinocatenispora comari]|nr:aminoglycoside adenylyltransferase domain-containing protein [Actinocatenispora comari]